MRLGELTSQLSRVALVVLAKRHLQLRVARDDHVLHMRHGHTVSGQRAARARRPRTLSTPF